MISCRWPFLCQQYERCGVQGHITVVDAVDDEHSARVKFSVGIDVRGIKFSMI
jgi:hypothetical protein